MSVYVDALVETFLPHANWQTAQPMKAYMRNQFDFLGIKSPQQRELLRQFISDYGLPPLQILSNVLLELWGLPEREYQYTALSILDKMDKDIPPDFLETIEALITTKSWWDTVDALAARTVGTHFRRFPDVKDQALEEWRRSENIWLRRTCLLFQLKYKEKTDFSLLCEIIRENLGDDEFFINKAIGWALRQFSKVDAASVRNFVAETPLHPLSAREALKWLTNQEEKES